MERIDALELEKFMYVDTLFDRLPDCKKKFLGNQYRMTNEIGDVISKYFYNSELKNGRNVSIPNSILWCDYNPTAKWGDNEGSPYNLDEVNIVKQLLKKLSSENKKQQVAVISPYKGQNKKLKEAIKIDAYKKAMEEKGAVVEEISLATINEIQTAWTILMSAETTNNLSRFDGVKYGHRTANYKNIDDLYVGSRTEAFGFLTKATIIYGSDVLSKGRYDDCYDKALKIRRVAVETLKDVFAKFDAILTPAGSSFDLSYKTDAFLKVFEESKFTALASITGMPAVVTKGVQLIGDHFADGKLLKIAEIME
jgi:Asp-tRNA(Asn)/Glu-tRNA(Gln) amidotransferase A subunit family amidase